MDVVVIENYDIAGLHNISDDAIIEPVGKFRSIIRVEDRGLMLHLRYAIVAVFLSHAYKIGTEFRGGFVMEAIRKYIDASTLMSVMTLPETFKNRKLEVLIFPAEEQESVKRKADIESVVQSLIGAIPNTDMSLEELREERLQKYEIVD